MHAYSITCIYTLTHNTHSVCAHACTQYTLMCMLIHTHRDTYPHTDKDRGFCAMRQQLSSRRNKIMGNLSRLCAFV